MSFLSLREGGARFATANLAYPGLRCQNAFGVPVPSHSLTDHVKMCTLYQRPQQFAPSRERSRLDGQADTGTDEGNHAKNGTLAGGPPSISSLISCSENANSTECDKGSLARRVRSVFAPKPPGFPAKKRIKRSLVTPRKTRWTCTPILG